MLLSRKRLRETESPLLRGPEQLLAFKSSDCPMDGKQRLLRDFVDASAVRGGRDGHDALLELLARLQERDAVADASDTEMSRAHVNSQELFLSVVLEWQRSGDAARRVNPARRQYASSYLASSSCVSSDDDEQDGGIPTATNTKRLARSPHKEVSPTSVHIVPSATLTPLRLNDIADTPHKRIGIYTPRARQQLLQKYMAKRARRLSHQHKVRYGVRKTLANARPRVKGRFVKTETPLTAALVQQTHVPAPTK